MMAGFDKGVISVVDKGHKQYDLLDVSDSEGSVRHQQSTKFYDDVITAYNDSKVGAILIVPLPEGLKFYNLNNVFKFRGLARGKDVVIARQQTDMDGKLLPRSERPAKLKKLTKTKGRIIDTSR
jgi:hypothetical protein